MAEISSITNKGGELLGSVTNANWGLIFVRGALVLIILLGLYIAYKMYTKYLDTKFKARVKYDTDNGIRVKDDNVLLRKHPTGRAYYFLEKLKLPLPKIDPSNVTYRDKGKPVVDFFLDKEKNLHPIKFIQDRPVYDNRGEVVNRTPLAFPYQTGEEKAEFAGWLREKNAQYANQDWLTKYGAFALMGVGIIVMAFIIVSAKVAG